MFKLFKSIGRLFRAMIYTLVGDISKWSEVWEASSSYIRAEYDEIKSDQVKTIKETTDAVASLMELQTQKEARVEKLGEDIESLKRKKVGAKAKADKTVQALQKAAKSVAEIKADPTIQKCMDFYENFTSTLQAKEEEVQQLEGEIEKHQQALTRYKLQLQKMHHELKVIRQEEHETVADVEIAKAEQKVNNALTGISERGSDERRQRIQQQRRKQRARADISAEMAGVATEDVEEEFEKFAVTSEAESEFFGMLGLEEKVEAPTDDDTKLPE